MKYKTKELFLVVIHGSMGSGKTTLADILHDEIENLAHFGTDHIKWLISDGKGENANPDRLKVSKEMVKIMSDGYLRLGTNILVEQAFTKDEIDELETIAKKYKAKFLVYEIKASKETLHKRIAERTQKLNKPEISKERIEKHYVEYQNNKGSKGKVLDSEEMTIREMADVVLEDLRV